MKTLSQKSKTRIIMKNTKSIIQTQSTRKSKTSTMLSSKNYEKTNEKKTLKRKAPVLKINPQGRHSSKYKLVLYFSRKYFTLGKFSTSQEAISEKVRADRLLKPLNYETMEIFESFLDELKATSKFSVDPLSKHNSKHALRILK